MTFCHRLFGRGLNRRTQKLREKMKGLFVILHQVKIYKYIQWDKKTQGSRESKGEGGLRQAPTLVLLYSVRDSLKQSDPKRSPSLTHIHRGKPVHSENTSGRTSEKSRGKDAQVAGLHWHYSVQRSSEEVVACQGNHSQWEARVGLAWMSNRCVLKVGAEVGEQGPALPWWERRRHKNTSWDSWHFFMNDQWAGHFQVHGPCWVLLYCWLLFFCEMDLPHHTHKWMYSFTAGVYLITTVISDTNNYSLF